MKEMQTEKLATALHDILNAIKEAKKIGCIEHLDCWVHADELWYEPIERAETLLSEVRGV